MPLTPRSQARLDQALAPARLSLPAETADAAWHEGLRLDADAAIAAALAITELAPAPDSPGGTRGTRSQDAGASVLTEREAEVARLIAQGHSNKQIAEVLVVTEGTAANHVHNVLGKLELSNRAQVAAWVREHGL